MANMIRCTKCGELCPAGYKHCPKCGKKLKLSNMVTVSAADSARQSAAGCGHGEKNSSGVGIIVIMVAVMAVVISAFLIKSALKPISGLHKETGKSSVSTASPSIPSADLSSAFISDPQNTDEAGTGSGAQNPDEQAVVESVVLSQYMSEPLSPGDTLQLSADVYPSSSAGLLKWRSENESVAVVDVTGLVTAIGEGTATIVASALDKSVSCVITVSGPGSASVPGVSVSEIKAYNIYYSADSFPGEMSIGIGETVQMCADADGSRVHDGLVWSSSDESVATVTGDGIVRGVGGGSARITVQYGGQSASCLCRVA